MIPPPREGKLPRDEREEEEETVCNRFGEEIVNTESVNGIPFSTSISSPDVFFDEEDSSEDSEEDSSLNTEDAKQFICCFLEGLLKTKECSSESISEECS